MILYHYTHRYHLATILETGYLKTVESNISLTREHAGPDVVWLTDEPDLAERGAAWSLFKGLPSPVDKTEVRLSVEVEDAIPWRSFARHHKIKLDWYATLNEAGGGAANHWYVVPRRIGREEWVDVQLKPGIGTLVAKT